MLSTVQFDHQKLLQADEVDYIRAYGLLTLELEAHETVSAQVIPEPRLGVSHLDS